MSAYSRLQHAGYTHTRHSAAPIDFTEALLLIALALGAKAVGLW